MDETRQVMLISLAFPRVDLPSLIYPIFFTGQYDKIYRKEDWLSIRL